MDGGTVVAFTVRDAVHGSIHVPDWMEPIIDSPTLQRLRRVRQLGTGHLVYPGAHHNRFEHSLGASHVAGRLAELLGFDDDDTRLVRAAALLHDVGHGPFSHAFEELTKQHGHRHEEATVDLVQWGPLADPLRRGGVDPVAVAEAVQGQGRLGPLVAGSLDADRMDYLVRDAHYTGVRSAADPDRICGVLQLDDDHGVVLREAGVVAAEAFLATRFLMYPAVYLHHTVRASETMLQAAIEALLADPGSGGQERPALQTLARETDDGLEHLLRQGPPVAAELMERLDARRLYKRAHEGRWADFEALAQPALATDGAARRQVAAEIAGAAGLAPHEVILDVPHAPKYRELDLRVLRRDGDVVPLVDASRLVRALHEARMDHWRFWVFAPARQTDAVATAAADVLAS